MIFVINLAAVSMIAKLGSEESDMIYDMAQDGVTFDELESIEVILEKALNSEEIDSLKAILEKSTDSSLDNSKENITGQD